MKTFTIAVYRLVQGLFGIALFPIFCVVFRHIVGVPPDLGPVQREGMGGVPLVLLTAALSPCGPLYLGAIGFVAHYWPGLKHIEARVGLMLSLAASMAAAFVAALACQRGTAGAELTASLVGAAVFAVLGSSVLYQAVHYRKESDAPRVVAGGRAATYEEMKSREYRDLDF